MSDKLYNALIAEWENETINANCKRFLATKKVAAYMLQELAKEYKGLSLEQIASCIEGEPKISEIPVDSELTGKNVNTISNEPTSIYENVENPYIIFDAALPDQIGKMQMIINIANQNNYDAGYSLATRGIYDCLSIISIQQEQVFVNPDNDGLKKVHSVWICMHPEQDRQSTIATYEISEQNDEGTIKTKKSEYDKLQTTIICLGKPDTSDSEGLLDVLEALLVDNISVEEKLKVLKQYGICDSEL